MNSKSILKWPLRSVLFKTGRSTAFNMMNRVISSMVKCRALTRSGGMKRNPPQGASSDGVPEGPGDGAGLHSDETTSCGPSLPSFLAVTRVYEGNSRVS